MRGISRQHQRYLRNACCKISCHACFNCWGKGESLGLSQLSKGLEKMLSELNIKKTAGHTMYHSNDADRKEDMDEKSRNILINLKRRHRMDRMSPLPRNMTQKLRRDCAKSSGYGYGVIKTPTQLENVVEVKLKALTERMETIQLFEKSSTNGVNYSMVKDVPSMNQEMVHPPSPKKLEFLIKKISKECFSGKLACLDNHLKCTLQKSFRDLSVRPGNISCGVDGGYMKVIS